MSEIQNNATPPAGIPPQQPSTSKRPALSARFWFKLIAGCLAFAGILDFLKGVLSVDLQSPSVLIGGALFIALTLLMRNIPDRARQLHIARTVVATITVAIMALFGVQAQVTNGSQNGAIAQTFDWAHELQADLRQLLLAVRVLDPRNQANQYLAENGYPVSLEGFSRAAGLDDGAALSAFSVAGFRVSAEEFSDLLTAASTDAEALDNTLRAMAYLSAEDSARFNSGASAILGVAGEDYGLNKMRALACGAADPDNWIYRAVRAGCENEAQWYVQTRSTLSSLAGHLSIPLTFSSYEVAGNFGRLEDIDDRESNVLLRFRTLANFRNGQLFLYSDDLQIQVVQQYDGLIPGLDCSETLCSIDLHAAVLDHRLEVLDVRDVQVGPFFDLRTRLNAGEGFDWTVGYTPRWGNLVWDHAIYMAAYDAEARVGAAIFCEPQQGPGGTLTLRYIFNVAPQQAYDHLFQSGRAGNQFDQGRIQLANGLDIEGPAYRRGLNVRDVAIYDPALEAMLSSSSTTFKPSLSENYPIETRTLLEAFSRFKTYSACSAIDPASIAAISETENRWFIDDSTNRLSGNREVTVYNDATEVGGRGTAPVTLYIRCRDNTTEGFIIWRRPLQSLPGRPSVPIAFRLDNGPIRSETWNLANTGEGVFFPVWSGNLARELYAADNLVAQVPVTGQGDITATFDIRGGHEELATLAQACGWDIGN